VYCFRSSDSSRDVLVTGLGLVTPLGATSSETWSRLLQGDRAARALTADDIDGHAGLTDFSGLQLHGAPGPLDKASQSVVASGLLTGHDRTVSDAWMSEPSIAMALAALEEAITASQWDARQLRSNSPAVVFGSSKPGMRSVRRHPEHLQVAGVDSATRAVATVLGTHGSVRCPVAACATGLIAVLQGAALVHSGASDVCIAGSSDAALTAAVLASFHRLRVTSRAATAATACRPFDRDRDGFVIGEGAAVLVLESRASAMRRRVRALARVDGGGWVTDPTGITQIDESGRFVTWLLQRTLPSGFLPDLIGLHGTGTISNDRAEAAGLAQFDPRLCDVPCFGVKGALGHLLGAAGSVETGVLLMALQNGIVPPTTNLQHRADDCAVSVSAVSRVIPKARTAMRLSLGFGGHVACGLFSQPFE
jgi:3-oxoacyl-[acyl-carrier-protein] synthase II